MTFNILFTTLVSVYIGVVLYTSFIAHVFVMRGEELKEFWSRMLLVVNAIAPVVLLTILYFYKPISKYLKIMSAGQKPDTELTNKALKAFKSIEKFLFMLGFLAYVVGGFANMLIGVAKGIAIDPLYWSIRMGLSFIWAILNALLLSRLINFTWMYAKYMMGITKLEKDQKKISTFGKIGFPIIMLCLFIIGFTAGAISYYGILGQKGLVDLSSRAIIIHFLPFMGSIFAFSILVVISLILETQAHMSLLQRQVLALSEGTMDLSKRIFIVSYDDVGYMTSGVNLILDRLQDTFKAVHKSEQDVSYSGTKTKDAVEKSRTESGKIMNLVDIMKSSFDNELMVINNVNNDINALVDSINTAVSSSQEQSSFIEKVSASMNNMAQSFKKANDKAINTGNSFKEISEDLASGQVSVNQMLDANKSMIEANDKIREIASLIMDISDKSNLLAMNASIEAAHAGVSGKGFAVVAGEVRKLALSTADAAKNIDSFVQNVLEKNEETQELNLRIASVFSSLSNGISAATAGMNEISSASEEEIKTVASTLSEIGRLLERSKKMKEEAKLISETKEVLLASLGKLKDISEETENVNRKMTEGLAMINSLFGALDESYKNTFSTIEELGLILNAYKI